MGKNAFKRKSKISQMDLFAEQVQCREMRVSVLLIWGLFQVHVQLRMGRLPI